MNEPTSPAETVSSKRLLGVVRIVYVPDGESCSEEESGVKEWTRPLEQMLNQILEIAREPKTCSGRNFGLSMMNFYANLMRKPNEGGERQTPPRKTL